MNNYGETSIFSRINPAAYQLVPLLKVLISGFDAILISDGVGAGKTISSGYLLMYMCELQHRPGIIVSPPGLIEKWRLEMTSKFGFKVAVMRTPQHLDVAAGELESCQKWARPSVYIMSNSLLRNPDLMNLDNLSTVVFDEIHNYRNRKTHGYKGAHGLALNCGIRVGLSATPINNSLADLASELSILLPDVDVDILDFIVEDTWHIEKDVLSTPLTTRFTKEAVGIHFARREVEEHRVSYANWYYKWVNELIASRRATSDIRGFAFENITLYRLASSSPRAFSKAMNVSLPMHYRDEKLNKLMDLLNDLQSERIIIFCGFKETVAHLASCIEKQDVFVMTGDTPIFERPSIIERFKASHNALMLLTSVGSEGLDLQFADTIINFDMHWNPMIIEQRIGRIDRVGQLKDEIKILNIIVTGSIDERVMEVLREKLQIISGSIFEPNKIVESSIRMNLEILDRETFEKEVERSDDLVTAYEWSSKIPTIDYDILDSIDISYCSKSGVREAAASDLKGLDMISKGAQKEKWAVEIERCSKKLRNIIEFYS